MVAKMSKNHFFIGVYIIVLTILFSTVAQNWESLGDFLNHDSLGMFAYWSIGCVIYYAAREFIKTTKKTD